MERSRVPAPRRTPVGARAACGDAAFGCPSFGGLMGLAFLGACGAAIGSFVNVLAYRLPRRESIVTPRSRCPHCGTQIAGYDNIPVVSWLVLRGRCRHCDATIPVRYP